MKKIKLFAFIHSLVIVSTLGLYAQAPDWQWVKNAGGISYDEGKSIALDIKGNVYVTGRFVGIATFGTTTLTSNGDNNDIFVVKYDVSGNVLWANKAGGTDSDVGNSIAIDASGNAYVIGSFRGSASFGTATLTSKGDFDIFVAKYDASGNVLWAKSAGGAGWDDGNSIAVDAKGNPYVTGRFVGNANFGTTSLVSSGNLDIFIASFDASGNILWAKSAGGKSRDEGTSITADANGNAYVTGYFGDTTAFGTTTLTSSGDNDIFISKYDANGNVLWAKSAGGTDSDEGSSIALDASGNAYVTGSIWGKATFDNTVLVNSDTRMSKHAFTAKYDAGGIVLWAKSAEGTSRDAGKSIALDRKGNAYVTGDLAGTAIFGTTTLSSSASVNIFVVKFDTNGNILWAESAGGISKDVGKSIAVDAKGNVYITGEFSDTTTFGTTSLTGNGKSDIFVVKLQR